MAIFITGDTHGDIDFHKLDSNHFREAGEGDYVIVCGDFGCCWDGDARDRRIQDWYNSRPWTTLFVDGNHENHDLINSCQAEEWNGGKVHRISEKIIHLMRGQIFTIEGKTFFTMGGATSQDRMYRQEGKSWWPSEMPSREEMDEAIANLDKVQKVDYILTHCAPASVQQILADWYSQDSITRFLELVCNNYEFGHWFFGHYHVDRGFGRRFTCLYDEIVKLE